MTNSSTKYVSTTLEDFLNESRNITLTRKYGEKEPVVVSSKAPLRNSILQYVAENAKVTKNALKKHIMGINESAGSNASALMWMKRNEQYFITENKNGVTFYRLSPIGKKLVDTLGLNEDCNCGGGTVIKKDVNEGKKHDFVDDGKAGIYDEDTEKKDKKKSHKKIKELVESIKARMFEAENEEDEDEEKDEDEDEKFGKKPGDEKDETDGKEDEESDDEAEDEAEDEESDDEGDEEDEEGDEDDEKSDDMVEITEFIIDVDDPDTALAELADLGIVASKVEDEAAVEDDLAGAEDDIEGAEDDLAGAEDDIEGTDDDVEGLEDIEDIDLDLDGDISGEDQGDEEFESVNEDDEEIEDIEGIDDLGAEDDIESAEDDLAGAEDDLGGAEDDLAGAEDDIESAEDEIEGAAPATTSTQIRVSADNWDALKGWLEGKGVDTEELFGGEIVSDDDDVEEEEINFDELENLEKYEDDDDDEDDKKDDKKDDNKFGKKEDEK
jgi:hypothetical protein